MGKKSKKTQWEHHGNTKVMGVGLQGQKLGSPEPRSSEDEPYRAGAQPFAGRDHFPSASGRRGKLRRGSPIL